jgi:hypothetical protein
VAEAANSDRITKTHQTARFLLGLMCFLSVFGGFYGFGIFFEELV